MPVGPLELVIVLLIVLLLFGAKRLPELARSMGTSAREFKDSVDGRRDRDRAGELPPPGEADSDPLASRSGERVPAVPTRSERP